MSIFSTSPRIPPKPPANDAGSYSNFSSFAPKPYVQRSPRLEQFLVIQKDKPSSARSTTSSSSSATSSRRFRLMLASQSASDRSSFLPTCVSGGYSVGVSDDYCAAPAMSGKVDVTMSSRFRARSVKGTIPLSPRADVLTMTSGDAEGPARFNPREADEAKLEREWGHPSAAFRPPLRIHGRMADDSCATADAPHAYLPVDPWKAKSFHKNVVGSKKKRPSYS